MKEKLIIKNFGPIISIDLDLGKITVLIGEQASGKSTVVKVLAICRYFSYIVNDSSIINENYESEFVATALRDWGLNGYEKTDSYINYTCSDYSVEIISEKVEIDKKFSFYSFIPKIEPKSHSFRDLLNSFYEIKPRAKENSNIEIIWGIPHSFLMTDVKSVMDNPFYFPTERGLQSIFSLGKSSIPNLSDSLFNQFAKLDQIARNFKNEVEIEPLNLIYKNQNGEGYFKIKGQDNFYKLSQGASGFKTSIPIILGIKYYNSFKSRNKTFIIEEPEQNLFPTTQKKLLEFFVESINTFENSFLIPTHSPYILTALENLMYAHKMGSKNQGELKNKVNKIISEKYWIDQEDVNVYYLGSGSHKDILQREEALIDKDYIDSVSKSINSEYDQLLALDVAMQH